VVIGQQAPRAFFKQQGSSCLSETALPQGYIMLELGDRLGQSGSLVKHKEITIIHVDDTN